MEARQIDLLNRLRAMFPESDETVLSALLDRGEAVARYLAQTHEVTVTEAAEGLDWALSASRIPQQTAIAAE